MPASLGVQGPGDSTMPLGFELQHLGDRDLVVAEHLAAAPELAQEVDEVIGEAVVVIDQDEHGKGVGEPEAAASRQALGRHEQPRGARRPA